MAKAIGDPAGLDVEQVPLARPDIDDPQRVVEAVRPDRLGRDVGDAHRDEVAEHRQGRGAVADTVGRLGPDALEPKRIKHKKFTR
mgnify:CR=1 FL=1